ncbi:FAD-binding monooxygenase aflW [Cladobotryum mycophilum]|uniref:FAD-binding monooxygenase aflW n=1 Tax=Cladobotryum mycophilum TaxID=491253 RepID=A0ABR0SKS4_9HYPO
MGDAMDLPTSPCTAAGSKPSQASEQDISSWKDGRVDLPSAAKSHKYHVQPTKLVNRFIDEPREIRVAVIGAGLAGVSAGILLPAKVPGIKLTIFDKNAEVGGTWFENIYPGVRCDVPAHVYQSTFDSNTQWSEEFAQGPEILNYWKTLARKYEVYKLLKLAHKVESLDWDPQESAWLINVHDLTTDTSRIEKFDFVITAIGRFNNWKLPDYPGIRDYKGLIRHTSNWDPNFDVTGKKVAVIGNGASGIQLVANIQKRVERLDHYARNPTWIAQSFGGHDTSIEPKVIPQELMDSFKDPETYLKYRKVMEDSYFRGFNRWLKGSESNTEDRDHLTELARTRLAENPELFEKIIPEFSPHCRRLTPGPGYLEAISQPHVDYIQTPIKRFTDTGIETTDGKTRDVDAIFCATGANIDAAPPFPIRSGMADLSLDWKHEGAYGFPYTYLGAASPGFPNLLFLHGPSGSGRAGTVPYNVENQVTYFAKILRKVSREGIKTMAPSKRAADDFVAYTDAFFDTTVLSENCSSCAMQMTIIQQNPRWEDWEYEYLSKGGNRFAWYFGNGRTRLEADPEVDVTAYLSAEKDVDLRGLHENWWSVS